MANFFRKMALKSAAIVTILFGLTPMKNKCDLVGFKKGRPKVCCNTKTFKVL